MNCNHCIFCASEPEREGWFIFCFIIVCVCIWVGGGGGEAEAVSTSTVVFCGTHISRDPARWTLRGFSSIAGQFHAPQGSHTSIQFISVNGPIHQGNLECRLCFPSSRTLLCFIISTNGLNTSAEVRRKKVRTLCTLDSRQGDALL